MDQEALERRRRLEEEAHKAKRSPIGFSSVRQGNVQPVQVEGSSREGDYDQNRQASKKPFYMKKKK